MEETEYPSPGTENPSSQSVASQTNSKMFGEFQLLTNLDWELRMEDWRGGNSGRWRPGDESMNGGGALLIILLVARWMANCPWGYKWNLKLFYQHFWLLPAEQSLWAECGSHWLWRTLIGSPSRHPETLIICTKVMNSHTTTMEWNGQYVPWTMEMINFRVPGRSIHSFVPPSLHLHSLCRESPKMSFELDGSYANYYCMGPPWDDGEHLRPGF